jgi:hypothetical protein
MRDKSQRNDRLRNSPKPNQPESKKPKGTGWLGLLEIFCGAWIKANYNGQYVA